MSDSWSVVVPLPIPALDFLPPYEYQGPLPLGHRVVVPWRADVLIGLVIGEGTQGTREVISVLDTQPWVSLASLEAIAAWGKHAHLPAGLLWSDLLGVGWDTPLKHEVKIVAGANLSGFTGAVPTEEFQAANLFKGLDHIREQSLLDERITERLPTKQQLIPISGASVLTEKQTIAWNWLQEKGYVDSFAAWAKGANVGIGVVNALEKKGYVQRQQVPADAPLLLQAEAALPLPDRPDPLPHTNRWRLHGGRTNTRFATLSLRVLERLKRGEGVLILAPDAATLTRAWNQLSGRAAQAGTTAVLLNGTLSPSLRRETWQQIQAGTARLVIGTYLALTAPIEALSLVIVLEEGSDAYQLLSGSRSFLPDIVQHFQQEVGYVGLVPAVESIPLEGLVLPTKPMRIHVVDFSPQEAPEIGPLSSPHLKRSSVGYPLSHDLIRLLYQVRDRERSAALIVPRRGYSALLRCLGCGTIPHCQNCDIPLRFHQTQRLLDCHQCGYHIRVPEACSSCGQMYWQARGAGTEWIVDELKQLGLPVWQYDRDQQDDLSELAQGKSGIVVGTSALLGYPTLPVSLIGITLADTWLHLSDFRASERYHSLIHRLYHWPQKPPLMVVQTFQAQHPALETIVRGADVMEFPQTELSIRQALGYPPAMLLARLTLSSRDQERAEHLAQTVTAALWQAGASTEEVLGPAPSPVARLRGVFPYHILLRARNNQRLGELLDAALSTPHKIKVELNPRGSLASIF